MGTAVASRAVEGGDMNLLLAAQLLGWLLVLVAGFQLPVLLAAWAFGDPVAPVAAGVLITTLIGLPFALGIRPESLRVRPRDAFFIVSASWAMASLFGALPYVLSGLLTPVDAVFESVAGFTTTGSTVLTDIESAPRSLLLWRSMTQWLGGMGIVVFTVALMPLLGIGGMQLFRAEVPGPVAEKLRPRVAETARQLWLIYVGLTALEWVALVVAGMGTFDALCHALTTLSTGGFSTRGASIGAYDSAWIHWIVTLFMLLAGINFVLHYRLLTGRVRDVWRDAELRYFLAVVASAIGLVVLARWGAGDGLREAAFQVVSIVTSTGFATDDFERWPPLAQLVLLQLMVLGAMAGSTSGGIKSLRAVLGFRALRSALIVASHRNAVRPAVRYSGKAVPSDVLAGVWAFFAAYVLLVAVMALCVAAADYDLLTALSTGVTVVSNVGPGLGEVGPFDHFAHFPAWLKLVLAGGMIAGRLEIFTLLVLFSPSYWRR